MPIHAGPGRRRGVPGGFRWLPAALVLLLGGGFLASEAAASGGAGPGAPEPTLVSLRPESTIRGVGIRLGDVADIKGADPALVTRLRAIDIGRAPLPGLSRTLDLPYIKARLRLVQIDPEGLTWDVPAAITVVAASQRLTGSDLVAAAREQVEARRGADAGPASIQPTVLPPDLTLPDGALELKAQVRPGTELTGTVPVTVEAWVDGTKVRALSVALRVVPLVEVLVAARLIPRGTILTPDDVRADRRTLVPGVEPLREPGAVLGQRAIRNIAPGDLILPTALEFPPLVRRGDIVTLTVTGPGLVAVTQGEAREDGKAGQIIREQDVTEPEKSPIFSNYPGFLRDHHALTFMCDSIKLLVDGAVSPVQLETMMDAELETHHEEGSRHPTILTRVGDSLPGLGIVAAVLGVVITMQAINGPPEEISHKVAVALVGTFIGILLCYGFVSPLASNLEALGHDEAKFLECIKAGILAFANGSAPIVAVEFARRVIFSYDRPTNAEMEAACKGIAAR